MQLCQGQNYTIKICPKRHASDGKKKNHNWSFTVHFVKVHTHIPCEPVSGKSMLLLSMPVNQNCSQHRNTGVLCCSAWPSGHYFAHWHGLEKQRMMLIEKESFKHNHTPLTDTLSPGKCQVLWMTGHLDWHIQYSAPCTWPLCTRWLMQSLQMSPKERGTKHRHLFHISDLRELVSIPISSQAPTN